MTKVISQLNEMDSDDTLTLSSYLVKALKRAGLRVEMIDKSFSNETGKERHITYYVYDPALGNYVIMKINVLPFQHKIEVYLLEPGPKVLANLKAAGISGLQPTTMHVRYRDSISSLVPKSTPVGFFIRDKSTARKLVRVIPMIIEDLRRQVRDSSGGWQEAILIIKDAFKQLKAKYPYLKTYLELTGNGRLKGELESNIQELLSFTLNDYPDTYEMTISFESCIPGGRECPMSTSDHKELKKGVEGMFNSDDVSVDLFFNSIILTDENIVELAKKFKRVLNFVYDK